MHESRGLLVRERLERERDCVRLAAAPTGPSREQFRTRRRDDEGRHAARPVREVVDEVEHAVVCEVEILEDEHERPLLGERLQEAAPRRKRLVAPIGADPVCLQADEWTEVALEPVGVRAVEAGCRDRLAELRSGVAYVVRVEHAGLRLHDLRERPEAHSLAVRQRATLAPEGELAAASIALNSS